MTVVRRKEEHLGLAWSGEEGAGMMDHPAAMEALGAAQSNRVFSAGEDPPLL